jgi:hypothetical protein
METKSFIPDEEYIKKRIEDAKVQEFLIAHKKRFYMVIGLMIAYEPKAATLVYSSIDLRAKIGLDLSGGSTQVRHARLQFYRPPS